MIIPVEYSLIKGGIVNFTRYLATFYVQHDIRVNVVCPHGVSNLQDKKFVKKYKHLTSFRRIATPLDMAGQVLFLCSDAASNITGQVLMVDGGWSVW